jgi:hypothetical protein
MECELVFQNHNVCTLCLGACGENGDVSGMETVDAHFDGKQIVLGGASEVDDPHLHAATTTSASANNQPCGSHAIPYKRKLAITSRMHQYSDRLGRRMPVS